MKFVIIVESIPWHKMKEIYMDASFLYSLMEGSYVDLGMQVSCTWYVYNLGFC